MRYEKQVFRHIRKLERKLKKYKGGENMSQVQISNLINWFKEFCRVIVLAIIAYLLTEGVLGNLLDIVFGLKLDTATKLFMVGLVTSVLKGIDRQLHDSGIAEKGITRF